MSEYVLNVTCKVKGASRVKLETTGRRGKQAPLFLTNSARASIPFLVPRRVASW